MRSRYEENRTWNAIITEEFILKALDDQWRTPSEIAKRASLSGARRKLEDLYRWNKIERRTVNHHHQYRAKS